MDFIGYLAVNDIDLEVAKANSTLLDWYGSLDEVYEDYGEGADVTEIVICDFEIELMDGYIMSFEDMGLN